MDVYMGTSQHYINPCTSSQWDKRDRLTFLGSPFQVGKNSRVVSWQLIMLNIVRNVHYLMLHNAQILYPHHCCHCLYANNCQWPRQPAKWPVPNWKNGCPGCNGCWYWCVVTFCDGEHGSQHKLVYGSKITWEGYHSNIDKLSVTMDKGHDSGHCLTKAPHCQHVTFIVLSNQMAIWTTITNTK